MAVNLPCLWGSCPNFLRPTYPYTECQPSFQTGSCPTENTTAGYGSCFAVKSLLTWHPSGCTGCSVDAMPPSLCLSVGTDAVSSTPSLTGSLLQDPAQPLFYRQPFGRALEDMMFFRPSVLCRPRHRTSWTLDILKHLPWVVSPARSQNRKDNPEELACYHNQ